MNGNMVSRHPGVVRYRAACARAHAAWAALGNATESCEEHRARRPTLRAHLERRLAEDARRQAAAALEAADAAALRAFEELCACAPAVAERLSSEGFAPDYEQFQVITCSE